MEKNRFFLNFCYIMIIYAGYTLIFGIFNILAGQDVVIGDIHAPGITPIEGMVEMGMYVALIGMAVQLITGLVGLGCAKKPEKAGVCIFLGLLTALIYTASQILDFMGGGIHNTIDIIAMVGGFLIPIIFVVSAIDLKKGAK